MSIAFVFPGSAYDGSQITLFVLAATSSPPLFTCRRTSNAAYNEEFFRNPTADKAAASTLPSGLFEAFRVGARGTDKTPQGMSMEPAHKSVPIHQGTKRKNANSSRTTSPCQSRKSVRTRHHLKPKWLRTTPCTFLWSIHWFCKIPLRT